MFRPVVIHLVGAARPNFVKLAPLYHQLAVADWCQAVLVHTGQHYDSAMSDEVLADLRLPIPDLHLGVGRGSHAEQTASVMLAYEKVCLAALPDWVVVFGDVNSTLACTLAAKKLGLPVAHAEAGLRSHDRTMPEELNRVLVDSVADLLLTPSEDADRNLSAEGVPAERIERIGNLMIDAYELLRPRIAATRMAAEFGLEPGSYGVVTLHRPSNVDDAQTLKANLAALRLVAARLALIFPVHPRTRQKLEQFGLWEATRAVPGLRIVEPLGYIRFMSLVGECQLAITDSGGLQEETTYLGIPCLTLRETTERPITIWEGTNRLVTHSALPECVDRIQRGDWPAGRRPDLWDGRAAERAARALRRVAIG